MNHCVPDWNMENDSRSFNDFLPTANQRISTRPDDELVELLWQNGNVVMQSQTYRKTATGLNETKPTHKPEPQPPSKSTGGLFENQSSVIQEEETTTWLQYSLDDPLDKEFCSDFFYGLPSTDSSVADKLSKDVVAGGDRCVRFGTVEESNIFVESVFKQSNSLPIEENNTMPPPKSQVLGVSPQNPSAVGGGVVNFSHFSRPAKANMGQLNGRLGEKVLGNRIQVEAGESSSMMTKVSSNCGSNQVQNRVDLSCSNGVMASLAKGEKEDGEKKFNHERAQTDTHDTAVTSSSGGSGCSYRRTGQQSASNKSHKRKGRDADESECQSEDAEYESAETKRRAPRSSSARRSRAAEVHNLSERRRRDRINEKMKALQELIPHCNKSDKASMLDEAIEYLKSLQLQVQLMWMGSGMAPMMFPGVQHYISSMGMSHGPMPSIHGPVQFPRVPLVNQSMSSTPAASQAPVCPSPGLNPVNFPSQMQNARIPESYARYLGFHHMQPSPQAMNLYAYGSQLMPQNHTAVVANSSGPLNNGATPSGSIQIGKPG